MDDRKRRAGTVTGISYDSDHGDPPILYLAIDFHGLSQAFGGFYIDDEAAPAYHAAICDVLGVESLNQAVGREVIGLWCRGLHNETMEGIECAGKRFTITGFARVYYPNVFKPAKDKAQESILSTIAWAERRKREAEASLATLDAEWTEWETEPIEGAKAEG